MRVLLTTEYVSAPSTEIYRRLLEKINQRADSSFSFGGNEYQNFDVVMFMGYDPDIAGVKQVNPDALVGLIDVRPTVDVSVEGADFLLSNGVEMKDYWVDRLAHIFVYEPSWLVSGPNTDASIDDTVFRVGYHGNLVHLNEMFPRITVALETLGKNRQVEFTAVYNIENLGRWKLGLPDSGLVRTHHVQWEENAFDEHLSRVDVGITPNMTPFRDPLAIKRSQRIDRRTYLDDETDTLVRYKSNSNAGRMMVFAQYGIPVVSDPYPSASKFIGDESGGLIATTTGGWFRALERLASSPDYRTTMGARLRKKWENEASPLVLNDRLVSFLKNVQENRYPASYDFSQYQDYSWSRRSAVSAKYSSFSARAIRKLRRTFLGR